MMDESAGTSVKEKLLTYDESSSQFQKMEKINKQQLQAKAQANSPAHHQTKISAIGNSGQSDSSSIGSSSQPMGASFLDEYQRHQVLRGNLDKVARARQAHVRVYFSCNPQDCSLERSVLWKQVLPSLRERFRDQYDIEFQIIDLNAGPDNGILVSMQQRTNDIEKCHETSLSTAFVSLLSHKYWTSSLPHSIDGDLFDILLKVAYNSKLVNCLLLEECYERDENSIPPCFILTLNQRELSSRIIKRPGGGICSDVATSLQNLLHDSATHALNSNTITQQQADKILLSHVEKEINAGILDAKELHSTSCVCYVRTINGMETDMNYGRISNYIDVLPTSKDITGLYVTEDMLDLTAQVKLNKIREKLLPEKVIASNGMARVYKCAVTWMPQVGLQGDSHSEYIEDFNSHLQHVIIKMTAKRARQLRTSKPEHEILCHSLLAKTFHKNSQNFHGDEIEAVKKFLCNPESNICIIQGSKGSGKTHLISIIVNELRCWFDDNIMPICLIRLLGQTFLSSYVVLLLDSLNVQLEKCFKIKQENSCMWCTDVVFQKKRLDSLLLNATEEQPIVIVLDGLDQLVDAEDLKMWLPLQVPKHVKVILSCNSDSALLQQVQQLISEKMKISFVDMKNFTPSQGNKHLQRMLSEKKRHITSGQLVFALQSLKKDGNKSSIITPCMLNLVYAHATKWHSSKDVNKDTIGKTETDAVHHFIQTLQEKYGDCLVRITVSLITASKYGLTELELEEILPTYTSVIEDLKMYFDDLKSITKSNMAKFSDLIKRSLAQFLHHLLLDLSPLLTTKVLVGSLLYTWSNSVIKEIVESLYLTTKEQKHSMQKILVRYYLEYIGRGKYPTNQKVPLKTAHIVIELPHHFKDLGRDAEAMEMCYLNLHWLTAIIKTCGVTGVLFFLEQAFRSIENNRPLLIVERSIRLAIPILQRNLGAFPGEIFSRTLPFARIFPDLKSIISQCVLYKFDYPSLLPAGMHAQAPGAPLRVSFSEEAQIADQVLVFETGKMTNILYAARNRLKFFEMITGDPLKEMAFNDNIKWVKLTRDKQFVTVLSGSNPPTLCILHEKSSVNKNISLEEAFDREQNNIFKDWSTVQDGEVTIDSSISSLFLAMWIRHHGQQILLVDIKSAKVVKKISCEYLIHSCLISCDEQYLYSVNLPQAILIFSIASGNCLSTLSPLSFSSRGQIENLFESFDNHIIGVYSSGFVQVWKKSQKENFSHLYELDSRFSEETDPAFNVIHSSMSQDKAWLVLVKPTEIDVWNLKIWKTSSEIPCRKNEVFATAHFCNEQKFLLVTLADFDMSVYVWDLTSSPPACISIIDGHSSPIKDIIAPSFNSKTSAVAPWVVTVSEEESIKVWNLENIPLIPTLTLTGRPISNVFCAGNYTVTADYSDVVTVWRVSNADIVLQLKHSAMVLHVAVSEWTYKAVTSDENNFQYVWNLRNGQNLLKMKGPEINSLLITPNDQLVISIFENNPEVSQYPEASKVWKLDGGQVVCTFDYDIESAQVTSNNTFLVGISVESRLVAISLWTGKLTKVLGRPAASITLIHALSWHDHVISLDSQNFVTVWNIAEETSLMSLDMKTTAMSNVRICDSGAILVMTDSKNNTKVLDVTNGKLRKIETFGTPVITRLSWDGSHLIYVSEVVTQNDDNEIIDVKFYLVIFHLVGGGTLFTYPLEGVPTCMEVTKSGTSATVGLEEGRPVVFNVIGPDTKLSYPSEFKFKKNERMKFFPKDDFDQNWFSTEPSYEEGQNTSLSVQHSFSHSHSDRPHSSKQAHSSEKPLAMKLSMHMPRNNLKYDEKIPKPKVMRNLGNTTSKIKVFM